jgi:hypothetical protein
MMKKDNQDSFVFNSIIAQKGLILFSVIWAIMRGYDYYTTLQKRPVELFKPLTVFGKIIVASFPHPIIYSLFLALILGSSFLLLRRTSTTYGWIIKAVFVFCLLWINSVKWSYGYNAHVGHLLLLANLYALFIPPNLNQQVSLKEQATTFRWYYAGLFFTYSLSALWKLFTTSKDILSNDYSDSWLNLNATLSTAVCGHIWMDEPITPFMHFLFQFPFLWKAGFIVMTLIMLLAPLSAFKHKWFLLTSAVLIVFHIQNTIFIRAEFYAAPIALIVLTLPYHLLIRNTYAAFLKERKEIS